MSGHMVSVSAGRGRWKTRKRNRCTSERNGRTQSPISAISKQRNSRTLLRYLPAGCPPVRLQALGSVQGNSEGDDVANSALTQLRRRPRQPPRSLDGQLFEDQDYSIADRLARRQAKP